MLVFSTVCEKCGSNKNAIFKEEQSIEMLKFFAFISNKNK